MNDWHTGLSPVKRLVVSFAFHWTYWSIAWLVAEHFIFEEQRSWKYLLFHATWMSACMTIPFSWKDWKVIFKGRAE
ncbi:MAG: hypothetical protein MH132_07565 [Hydrotalea sp.]|nr:hypothetical protein [Hydrotalea sp.]